MKKLITIAMLIMLSMLMLSLSACGGDGEDNTNDVAEITPEALALDGLWITIEQFGDMTVDFDSSTMEFHITGALKNFKGTFEVTDTIITLTYMDDVEEMVDETPYKFVDEQLYLYHDVCDEECGDAHEYCEVMIFDRID
jgi:uncharacterized lipoprotein YehR (DUF1307 family)